MITLSFLSTQIYSEYLCIFNEQCNIIPPQIHLFQQHLLLQRQAMYSRTPVPTHPINAMLLTDKAVTQEVPFWAMVQAYWKYAVIMQPMVWPYQGSLLCPL